MPFLFVFELLQQHAIAFKKIQAPKKAHKNQFTAIKRSPETQKLYKKMNVYVVLAVSLSFHMSYQKYKKTDVCIVNANVYVSVHRLTPDWKFRNVKCLTIPVYEN